MHFSRHLIHAEKGEGGVLLSCFCLAVIRFYVGVDNLIITCDLVTRITTCFKLCTRCCRWFVLGLLFSRVQVTATVLVVSCL